MTAIAVLALAGALAAPVKSETAASGGVRATITYPAPVTHRAVQVRLVVDRVGSASTTRACLLIPRSWTGTR